nr:MAG TPA: hypothetical protein [Caudoviricetes sp.]
MWYSVCVKSYQRKASRFPRCLFNFQKDWRYNNAAPLLARVQNTNWSPTV